MKKTFCALLAALLLLTFALPVCAANDKPLTLDHVWQIDDHRLVLEFSEDIILGGAYIAIRQCTVDGSGRPTLAWEKGEPMQYTPSGGDFLDGHRLLLIFKESLKTLESNPKYTAYLAIEEYAPEKVDHRGLWDVVAAADPTKQLVANRPDTGANWDGVYIIPEPKTNYGDVTVKAPDAPLYQPKTDYEIGKKFPEPQPYNAPSETGNSQNDPASTDASGTGKSGCSSALAPLSLLPLLLCAAFAGKKH